jgi:hypothetical protein
MIKSQFYLLATLIVFASCNKKNNEPSSPDFFKVDSLKAKYLFSHDFHRSEAGIINADAWFYFDGNNIVKRVGANITGVGGGGYSGVYSKAVYDTVYRQNSLMILETMDTFSFANVHPARRELTIENGLLTKRILRASSQEENDTTFYYYDQGKKLVKTVQNLRYSFIERTYSYDGNDNLQRVDWKFISRPQYGSTLDYTAEEIFSDYDNSPNILKAYYMWEDIFLRTLSKNNFRSYSYKKISVTSGLTQEQQQLWWTYAYDSNGRIDFSK